MSERFICGGNKYELMGLNENVISLSVSFENLPKKIQVKEDTFYLPSPFHISLIYIQRIIDNYNILIPDFFNKIIEDFCDFTKTNNIELIGYKNEYKLVERNGKKTIVVMCEVSNLNKFFDLINEKYELAISNEILFEYFEIISNKTSEANAQYVINLLISLPNVKQIEPYFNWHLITKDETDNKFVDCAISANASFIVTEDKDFNELKHIDFPKINVMGINDFILYIDIL